MNEGSFGRFGAETEQEMRLSFPSPEAIVNMELRPIHEAWRQNQEKLLFRLAAMGPETVPVLATYGTSRERLERAAEHLDEMIVLPVTAMRERFGKPEGLLQALYEIADPALRRAWDIKESGVMLVYRFDTIEDLEERLWRSNIDDSLDERTYTNEAYIDTPLFPMTQFPIPRDSSQELSEGNWKWASEELDNSAEVAFFEGVRRAAHVFKNYLTGC